MVWVWSRVGVVLAVVLVGAAVVSAVVDQTVHGWETPGLLGDLAKLSLGGLLGSGVVTVVRPAPPRHRNKDKF